MPTFGEQLKAFAEKTKREADEVVVQTIIAIDRSLVEKTPVGNAELWAHREGKPAGYVGGRLRANWQYGEGEAPQGQLWTPTVGPYPDKNPVDVAPDAGGKVHYLVNNLDYATAIEEGHSTKQAPAGMVGITLLEFEQVLEEAVVKVKAGK